CVRRGLITTGYGLDSW
nr:immunoglobulin heavy chain junction region [Macaca mulatta]MOX91935.1 immunoglobulin heavy chain junction region [Macaca mulatta]MOX92534.1 immunoglobulin heavy chain junction region [Macaca mulatta]MOX93042.1 immunoglobulin heavy chain junction region [Macaca mulatta]MOX93251.1 immunoglobulin heavy chain junction region [Macaca mulatta]